MKFIDKIQKTDSEQFITAEYNPNVGWVYNKGVWLAYVLIILFVRIILGSILPFSSYGNWSIVHIVHGIVIKKK